ncbi:FAD-dependent oxidoreductase [Nocardia elegans]|uniref:FAD-dependent oxidoreductase n=1 Tax=Nocardia elegans TaxID=300029 RepID=UPI0018945A9A|nr:FAD-dependent oxidoreductase [Nocardia elegans]MBF6242478.1 FAD-dependent oxidoreductase [Nocardia elegans]
MTGPRVVIVGLGDTGVLTGIRLGRDADVVGITTKPGFVSGQELGLRLARPQEWMRDYRIGYDRFRGLDPMRIVHGSATALDTTNRIVRVRHVDGSSSDEPYDLVVIATGVTNGFWRHPALQDHADVDADLASHHRRIADAGTVVVVGGGAAAASCAAQIAERWPAKEVHFCFPGQRALPEHHHRVWTRVESRLGALGVVIHPGHRAIPPPASDLGSGPVEWSTGQPPTTADVVIWAIGRIRPNTAWLPPDMLDERGFVRVLPTLRVVGFDDVFAVGDVAATDRLRSSARNQGHKVLAHNLRAHANGTSLRVYRPPRRRWGSVLGVQRDGLTVYAPNGLGFRFPLRTTDALQRFVVRRGIYGGVREAGKNSGPAEHR